MPTVLEGVRVLDFTEGMSGSLATMLMADNGAEVIKAEPPSGDRYRSMPAWLMWNRGKKSVVLDLESAEGRGAAQQLAQQLDVVIENFRPGHADRLSIGYDDLARLNPGLVYCSITALGSKGAHRNLKHYDAILQAKAGAFLRRQPSALPGNPEYWARPYGAYGAANLAVQGIIGALLVRDKTGSGQRVETSLYQGLTCHDISGSLSAQAQLGLANKDLAAAAGGATINVVYLVVRCKDGRWLQMTNTAARLFPNWMRAIGLEHIYDDPRFKGAPFTFPSEEDRAELRRMMLEKMLERTVDEWMPILKQHDVGGDLSLTTQEAMDHPQILGEGGVVEIEDPSVGKMRQIGPLVQFSETPAETKEPAPLLGQHTEEVLASLKGAARAAAKARDGVQASQGMPKHPLEGVLILDFASWLAAPAASGLMADLGARVIKIEGPRGDEFRRTSRGMGRTHDGKESLVVDLKSEEGRQLIKPLIEKADVLLHNLRDGADQLGIDYETVRKINPRTLYVYASSYGSRGPGAGRPAFGPVASAMSGGQRWSLGRGNEPPPSDVPLSIDEIIKYSETILRAFSSGGSPDITSSIGVGTGIALGIYAQRRTGKGQYIETSMIMSNCYLCSEDFLRYEGKPPRLEPDRELRGLHALHRLYRTSEGWLFLSCPWQEEWEALCKAIGREELLKDRRFTAQQDRFANDDQLIAILAQAFKERSADEWEAHLSERDVAFARADKQSYADFFLTDPSVRENGFVTTIEHSIAGKMMRQGPPARLSLTPGRAEPSRPFGVDTPKIMAELGKSEKEILDLRSRGIVFWEEPKPMVPTPA